MVRSRVQHDRTQIWRFHRMPVKEAIRNSLSVPECLRVGVLVGDKYHLHVAPGAIGVCEHILDAEFGTAILFADAVLDYKGLSALLILAIIRYESSRERKSIETQYGRAQTMGLRTILFPLPGKMSEVVTPPDLMTCI